MHVARFFLLSIFMPFSDLLDEYGVRLNVIGKKSLLPISVQRAVEKAESLTRHNDR